MIYMQYARGTLALSDEACAAFLGTVKKTSGVFHTRVWESLALDARSTTRAFT